jgi:curved DNA-binding protein CbpA
MHMRDRENPYKTLGVSQNADQREIRTAYRNLAKKYHPDTGKGSSAERFRAIQDAYDLLSDTGKRKESDRSLTEPTFSRPFRYASYYSSPSSHIDLRNIRNRQPVEDEADPWEDLLDFLFWDF